VRVSSLGAYRLLENSFLRAETLDGVLHRLVYKPMNADQIRPNGWPGPESRDEFGFRTWKVYKKFTYDSPAPNALRYVRSENGLEMSKVLSMEVSTAVLDFSITLTDNGDKPVKDIYRLISGTCVGGIEDEYDENDFLLVPQEDLQFQMKQIVPESGRISIKPGGNVWGLIDRKKKLILLHVIREGVPKEFALVIGDLSEGGRSSVKRYVMQDVLEPFSLNPDEQIAYKYSWELIGGLKGLSSYREGRAMYGCLDTSGHKRGEKAVVTLQFGAAKSLDRNIKAVILCPDKNGRKISVAEISLPVSFSAGSPVEFSIPWTVPELPDGTYTVTIDFFEKDVKIGYATCPLVIGGITSAEIMVIVDESLGNIEKAEKTLPYLGGEFPDTLKDMILAEYYGQKVRDELYYDRLESARLFSGQMLDCSRKAQTDAVREKKDPYRRQRRSSVSREKREFCYSKDGMIFDPDGNRLYLNGMMHGPSLLNDTTVDSNIDRMMKRIRQNGNTVNILVFWKQMVPSKGEPIDQAYVARLDK